MRFAGANLNWVLQRDDNTYMEPADCTDRTDRKVMKKTGQLTTVLKAKVTSAITGLDWL